MKKIQFSIFCFLSFFAFDLLAVLHEEGLIFPLGTKMNQYEFLERFAITQPIDSGGESEVFEVMDKTTQKKYALVINRGSRDAYKHNITTDEINFFERMLEIQKINPHQVVIYGYFFIKRKSLRDIDDLPFDAKKFRVRARIGELEDKLMEELSNEQINSDEFRSLPEDRKHGVVHACYLLELGQNDLRSDEYKNFSINDDEQNLVMNLSHNFIEMSGIYTEDNKIRNYVFVKSENVFYGKKAMSAYPYWHYHINNCDFYLPSLRVVIKRVDYGGWCLQKDRYIKELPKLICLDKYILYRKKPDVPDDQILDILTYTPE